MIPIPELQVRGVYKVKGRNFSYGIWTGERFLGRRYKFNWFLTEEQHHDSDPYYGTVMPLTFLCLCPDFLDLSTVVDRHTNYAAFGYLTLVESENEAKYT
jgi:hypothetical protein